MIERCSVCGEDSTRRLIIGNFEDYVTCCNKVECLEKVEEEIYRRNFKNETQGRSYLKYKFSTEFIFFLILFSTSVFGIYLISEIIQRFETVFPF